MTNVSLLTYARRLETFRGYWDEDLTAARQLAAIGHVCDRAPLEALEEGSRCVDCSAFVKKDLSINALGDFANASRSYENDFSGFVFHHPSCKRHQIRIPLDPQSIFAGLHGGRIDDMRNRFDRRPPPRDTISHTQRQIQNSSLFSLPTEIRLEIYSMILPKLDRVTPIVHLNRDSPRVITEMGYNKAGRRDTTKQNILRTCRALNEEAIDLLYSNTTFKFGSTKVLFLFLRSIGKAGRDLVKSVDIICGGREDAIAFALLASCDNLRAICIRLPRPRIFFNRAPTWCVEGMSCLLALSGLDEVTFGNCESSFNCMNKLMPDAYLLKKELNRPKGSRGDDSVVQPYIDM